MSDDRDGESDSSLERSIVTSALCVLSFLAGAMTVAFESSLYTRWLQPSMRALEASLRRMEQSNTPEELKFWYPLRKRERFQHEGVIHHDSERAYQGYTLYTSMHDSASTLIDMEGRVVHEWRKPFREVWEDPPHVSSPVDTSLIYWAGSRLLPDGDLLAYYAADSDTPYGYGMVRLDRNSNVEWRYPNRVHHDVDVQSNGSIYALIHRMRDLEAEPISELPVRESLVLEDLVVRLSADGEELERISLLEAFASSPEFRPILEHWFEAGSDWDVLHTNNVERISADFAEHHDFARPGQLLFSFRTLHALAILDPETRQIVWAQRGPWIHQHDPDPLPNGHILIFDNKGYMGEGGPSKLVEYNPSTRKVAWRYTGDNTYPFATGTRGTQTILPNGNVLVVESNTGRIFEITREGDVVWEFINPVRTSQNGVSYIATIGHRVQRMPAEELDFTPDGPPKTESSTE